MAKNLAPTKGNLIAARNTLRLSRQGYEMLDKKRNILIREMMRLIDEAQEVERSIEKTFATAYKALEKVNFLMGIDEVEDVAKITDTENGVQLRLRSVMGVELPMVSLDSQGVRPKYSFYSTGSSLDEAITSFAAVKEMTVRLAEIENSVYRLAGSIKKTQKRANALQNITIPLYERMTKDIQSALEEKEREEHTRLKIIKKTKI